MSAKHAPSMGSDPQHQIKPGTVAHTYNASTQEAEKEDQMLKVIFATFQVRGQPEFHETLT